MFINFSNHPSVLWNEEQLNAAGKFGKIVDIEFPVVSVNMTSEQISVMAKEQINIIENCVRVENLTMEQTTIMCQGEFSLTYAIVKKIKEHYPECKVVCATSERQTIEEKVDNCTVKKVIFSFGGFREYV